METSETNENLFVVAENEYGSAYHEHIMQQYKEYIRGIEHISDRRMKCNSFFLSLNTALLGGIGYMGLVRMDSVNFLIVTLFAFVGVLLCYTWRMLIKSYRDLNKGKFEVLSKIEKLLPLQLHSFEWSVLGEGKNSSIYLPFTNIELRIPFVFMLLHAIIIAASVCMQILCVESVCVLGNGICLVFRF